MARKDILVVILNKKAWQKLWNTLYKNLQDIFSELFHNAFSSAGGVLKARLLIGVAVKKQRPSFGTVLKKVFQFNGCGEY